MNRKEAYKEAWSRYVAYLKSKGAYEKVPTVNKIEKEHKDE